MFCSFINVINKYIFLFLACWCNGGEWSSICDTPLVIVESLSESTSLSCSSRNYLRPALVGQDSHQCLIHSFLLASQTIFEIRYLWVKSQLIASTSKIAFWWIRHTDTKWISDDPASSQHFARNVQHLEHPSITLGNFSLQAMYISLGRIEQEVFVYEILLQC